MQFGANQWIHLCHVTTEPAVSEKIIIFYGVFHQLKMNRVRLNITYDALKTHLTKIYDYFVSLKTLKYLQQPTRRSR